MTPNSNYTSSLMFGIQWDLVCKFLEVKTTLTTAQINSNSTNWGNYNNVKIENIDSGKYAIYNEASLGEWIKISNSYTKQDSGNEYRQIYHTKTNENEKRKRNHTSKSSNNNNGIINTIRNRNISK